MSNKMVKLLSSSLIAIGAFVVGCSETNTSEPFAEANDGAYLKNDSKQMWARINESGSIATYFDSLSKEGGIPAIGVSTRSSVRCSAPALKMDENTRYLDELESLFDEGEVVDGVCGKALKLNDGQVAPLGVNLIDSLSVGTVEFWFRPNADFFDENARTLLGNDGARIHFFYKDGALYFQKNHHNQHYYAYGEADLKRDDWNLIAGQWGDGYMSLWLNGKLVAKIKHDKGYVPALRGIPFENLVVIGYKSSCCMEGPGQYESMTTSGSYDQVKISNIPRYEITDTDTVPEVDEFVPDTNWIVDYEFNNPKNVGLDYSGHGYHAIVGAGEVSLDSGIAYFDGKSGLKLAEGKDIQLGDFTVEARVYPESVSGYRNILVTEPPGNGPDGWILRIEDGSMKFFVRDADWGTDWQEVSVDGIKAKQWYNVRVECTSKSVRLSVNDSLKAEKAIAGNYDGLLYPWGVGYDAVNQWEHDRFFLGSIDYIRVGKFLEEEVVDTIPEIEDFVPDTNWVVDYEFNNPKNVGFDFSRNGYHAVVKEGEVTLDSGIAYFNGNSGLKLAEGKDIKLGDFAVEARIYPESVSGYRNILVTEPPGYGPDGWILRIENGNLKFFVRDDAWGTDWKEVDAGSIKANQWYNIRVECTSKSVSIIVNDTLVVETAVSGNYDNLLYPWGIGYDAVNQSAHNRYFLGYIDYIRVGKIRGKDVVIDTLPPVDTTVQDADRKCAENALVKDDKTLFFDEFESKYSEGTVVDGVCGKAISLTDGESISTGIELAEDIPVGTAEFWFRPGEGFDMNTPRTLLGNDGSRLHFFVKDGNLIFQKNHANVHYFVKGSVELKKDWNLIAGQWGDGSMSLWVNGKKIASMAHEEGYEPSDRYAYENFVVVGYKSRCCMEGPGQLSDMTTNGAFDQLRISSVVRYGTTEVEE